MRWQVLVGDSGLNVQRPARSRPLAQPEREAMKPFRIEIAQQELDDLQQRLAITRWPDAGPEAGWSRGIPRRIPGGSRPSTGRHSYDWRAAEAELNSFDQFTTEIDGANVHFLHVRSPEPDAVPLLLTHSWPGSFVEFLDLIGPLTDPRSHGADPGRAFHLVIPTIPGFGFSGPTKDNGWGRAADRPGLGQPDGELGYDRYIAYGGDWGMPISLQLGRLDPEHVAGVHVGMLVTFPPSPEAIGELEPAEQASLGRALEFSEDGFGYQKLLATRPQTVSYALTDSPVGQLAWIIEKFQEWSGCGRGARGGLRPGPAADQRDDLLADRDGRVQRADLLRGLAPDRGLHPDLGRTVAVDRPGRGGQLRPGPVAADPALGRAAGAVAEPLDGLQPGRPLRRDGAAGRSGRRPARLRLRHGAAEPAEPAAGNESCSAGIRGAAFVVAKDP